MLSSLIPSCSASLSLPYRLQVDGSRMLVQVQGIDKHGDGSRWVVRVVMQPAQPAAQGRANLVDVLDRSGQAVSAIAGLQHNSRSASPEPADAADFQ